MNFKNNAKSFNANLYSIRAGMIYPNYQFISFQHWDIPKKIVFTLFQIFTIQLYSYIRTIPLFHFKSNVTYRRIRSRANIKY